MCPQVCVCACVFVCFCVCAFVCLCISLCVRVFFSFFFCAHPGKRVSGKREDVEEGVEQKQEQLLAISHRNTKESKCSAI